MSYYSCHSKILVMLFSVFLWQNVCSQNVEWEFYGAGFSPPGVEHGLAMTEAFDGGYLIAGQIGASIFAVDLYLEKIDASGNTVWKKTHFINNPGIDKGDAIRQLPDSNYIIIGSTNTDSAAVNLDVLMMKVNLSGDTLWTKRYGGSSNDNGYAVDLLPDSGMVVAGNYRQSANNSDIYVLRTDKKGDTLWTRTFGGGAHDFGRSVRYTSDGNIIVCGTTRSYGPFGVGMMANVWLLKLDLNGDTLWTSVLGGNEEELAQKVIQTVDGGYLITGRTGDSFNQKADMYLVKTDTNGQEQWSKTYPSTVGNDQGNDLIQDKDGGYVIAGNKMLVSSVADRNTVYIMKTDSLGSALWDKTIETTGSSPNGGECNAIIRSKCGYILTGAQDIGSFALDFRSFAAELTEIPMITQSGSMLSTSFSGSSYQWIDCDNGNTPITGATMSSIDLVNTGNYAVIATTDTCDLISECFYFVGTGINNQVSEKTTIVISPNPLLQSEILRVRIEGVTNYGSEGLVLTITNTLGQKVQETGVSANGEIGISLSDLPRGIYQLSVISNKIVLGNRKFILR